MATQAKEAPMTPLDQIKQKAKAVWSDFASMENFTGMAAPR
jgi:hypothetical protein